MSIFFPMPTWARWPFLISACRKGDWCVSSTVSRRRLLPSTCWGICSTSGTNTNT